MANQKTPSFSIFSWILIFLVGGFIFLSGGCKRENPFSDPEYVAGEFMEALRAGNVKRAKELSTKETQASLEMYDRLSVLGYNPFEDKKEILRSEIEGQHASVYFRDAKGGSEKIIKLRKKGLEEWRVRISKADPVEDKGVNWAYEWMNETVPPEKQWELVPAISHETGATATAWAFLKALEEDRFTDAREYTDFSTRLQLNLYNFAAGWANPFKGIPFKLTHEEARGDTTYVWFRQQQNNLPRKLKLVREEKDWKISLNGTDLRNFAVGNWMEEVKSPIRDLNSKWEDWKKSVGDLFQ